MQHGRVGDVTGDRLDLIELGRQGDPEAQYRLAGALRLGELVPQDLERSLFWCRSAAEQGYAPAQNDYGSMVLNGMGCEANPEESVSWFRKAAEQGLAQAQWNLALRYLHGSGIAPDDNQAVLWLVMAYKQGHIEATSQLGTMFRFGRGVTRDLLMAAQLHVSAAKNGDPVAHGNLADYRSELEDLALDGRPEASLALAQIYEAGLGTDADLPEALAWLQWGDGLPPTQRLPDQRDERESLRSALQGRLDAVGIADATQRFRKLQSRTRE